VPARARRPRRRPLIGGVIAAVLAGGAGYGAAVVFDDDAGGEAVTITELDDGTVRVEQTVGTVTAAFQGPRGSSGVDLVQHRRATHRR
jgi:hypothetical protein